MAAADRILAEGRQGFEGWRDELMRRIVRDGINADLNTDVATWPTLSAGESPWQRIEDDED